MVVPIHSKIIYKPTTSEEKFHEVDEGNCVKDGHLVLKRNGHNILARVIAIGILVVLVIAGLVCLTRFIHKITWINEAHVDESYFKEMPVSNFKKSDNSTIYWNFKTGYQTVRRYSHGQYSCYVFKIDNSSATSMGTSVEVNGKKKVTNNIYEVNPDISKLSKEMAPTVGDHAYIACRNAKIFWLTSYSTSDIVDTNEEFSEDIPHEGVTQRRSKRSIRSCRTSCCWRVCCCDVHHFIWETVEEFRCNHVCDRCSKHYRPRVEKLC